MDFAGVSGTPHAENRYDFAGRDDNAQETVGASCSRKIIQ